jgi:hypothetical protein
MIAENESKYFQIRKDTVYAIVTLYLIGTMVSFVIVNTIFMGYFYIGNEFFNSMFDILSANESYVLFLNLNYIVALIISGFFVFRKWKINQNLE